ncbi:hypothetical protein BD410DRAFT_781021 [Rickenella mellea]|uniref:Uncharacterized protein n=1 Tax=Rickenella mellea TaxID=50990 RepID=A0A4Y7QLH3_9AGAM|nr:hypothetical protein BD410DRAFT_781021 [Rickenella mellea]
MPPPSTEPADARTALLAVIWKRRGFVSYPSHRIEPSKVLFPDFIPQRRKSRTTLSTRPRAFPDLLPLCRKNDATLRCSADSTARQGSPSSRIKSFSRTAIGHRSVRLSGPVLVPSPEDFYDNQPTITRGAFCGHRLGWNGTVTAHGTEHISRTETVDSRDSTPPLIYDTNHDSRCSSVDSILSPASISSDEGNFQGREGARQGIEVGLGDDADVLFGLFINTDECGDEKTYI